MKLLFWFRFAFALISIDTRIRSLNAWIDMTCGCDTHMEVQAVVSMCDVLKRVAMMS